MKKGRNSTFDNNINFVSYHRIFIQIKLSWSQKNCLNQVNSQQFMKNSKSGSKKKCLCQAEIFSQLSDSVSN